MRIAKKTIINPAINIFYIFMFNSDWFIAAMVCAVIIEAIAFTPGVRPRLNHNPAAIK